MVGLRSDSNAPRLESLNLKANHEWLQLAAQVVRAHFDLPYAKVNVTLEAAAERERQSPASPAYRLWMADNLARDGRYGDAIAAYDIAVERAQSAARLVPAHDPIFGALYHKAQAAALDGNTTSAIVTYLELGKHAPDKKAGPLFQAGLLAEGDGQLDRAAELYRAITSESPSSRTDDPAELARRALQRLEQSQTEYASNSPELVDLLVSALARRDVRQLERLVSRTHFAVGPVGGHTAFEGPELLQEFYRDLQASHVAAKRQLLGTGRKLYLATSGWQGKWFRGEVMFIITKAPQGWQWTGLAITHASELWLERWRPRVKQPTSRSLSRYSLRGQPI